MLHNLMYGEQTAKVNKVVFLIEPSPDRQLIYIYTYAFNRRLIEPGQ